MQGKNEGLILYLFFQCRAIFRVFFLNTSVECGFRQSKHKIVSVGTNVWEKVFPVRIRHIRMIYSSKNRLIAKKVSGRSLEHWQGNEQLTPRITCYEIKSQVPRRWIPYSRCCVEKSIEVVPVYCPVYFYTHRINIGLQFLVKQRT